MDPAKGRKDALKKGAGAYFVCHVFQILALVDFLSIIYWFFTQKSRLKFIKNMIEMTKLDTKVSKQGNLQVLGWWS